MTPKILDNSQKFIQQKFATAALPVNFVFMADPDPVAMRFRGYLLRCDQNEYRHRHPVAIWDGVRRYEAKNHDYLQGQIGNPDGEDKPNKKFYDPRQWLRAGEQAMVERLKTAFEDLNCVNRN